MDRPVNRVGSPHTVQSLDRLARGVRGGGHEGRFITDLLPVFSAGGPCKQFWHGQECALFDVHPAFPLPTTGSLRNERLQCGSKMVLLVWFLCFVVSEQYMLTVWFFCSSSVVVLYLSSVSTETLPQDVRRCPSAVDRTFKSKSHIFLGVADVLTGGLHRL